MNAIIFGASGMVGIEVLSQLLEDGRFEKVVSIARAALDIESPKLVQIRHENFIKNSAASDRVLKQAQLLTIFFAVIHDLQLILDILANHFFVGVTDRFNKIALRP